MFVFSSFYCCIYYSRLRYIDNNLSFFIFCEVRRYHGFCFSCSMSWYRSTMYFYFALIFFTCLRLSTGLKIWKFLTSALFCLWVIIRNIQQNVIAIKVIVEHRTTFIIRLTCWNLSRKKCDNLITFFTWIKIFLPNFPLKKKLPLGNKTRKIRISQHTIYFSTIKTHY